MRKLPGSDVVTTPCGSIWLIYTVNQCNAASSDFCAAFTQLICVPQGLRTNMTLVAAAQAGFQCTLQVVCAVEASAIK